MRCVLISFIACIVSSCGPSVRALAPKEAVFLILPEEAQLSRNLPELQLPGQFSKKESWSCIDDPASIPGFCGTGRW